MKNSQKQECFRYLIYIDFQLFLFLGNKINEQSKKIRCSYSSCLLSRLKRKKNIYGIPWNSFEDCKRFYKRNK